MKKDKYEVDYKELYKQKKEEILKNSKNFILFEIIISGEEGMCDINIDTATLDQVAAFYNMLKEEIEDLEKECPIIKKIAKDIAANRLDIEY